MELDLDKALVELRVVVAGVDGKLALFPQSSESGLSVLCASLLELESIARGIVGQRLRQLLDLLLLPQGSVLSIGKQAEADNNCREENRQTEHYASPFGHGISPFRCLLPPVQRSVSSPLCKAPLYFIGLPPLRFVASFPSLL